MSITTELTRLTNAKSAIKAAIEGKGVTVPDATLLDGMAALVEAIESGGGTIGGKKFISGNITFSETPTGKFTVEHEEWNRTNYGKSNVFVFLNGSNAPSDNIGALILLTGGAGVYVNSYKNFTVLSSEGETISDSPNTVKNYFTINAKAAIKMLAGKTYTWMRVAYA